MSFVKLASFMPDADPSQPGVITSCRNLLPTIKGLRAGPSAVSTPLPALAAEVRGSFISRQLDDTRRFIVGSQTKLYEAATSSWTDRTRAVGGDYTGSSDSRWRFTQYGDVLIAVNKIDETQASTSGAFSNLAGAPKALIMEAVDLFVLAFNTNEGTYGDSKDRWWCCKKGDYTVWTPAISDECVTARLMGSSGPIVGARRLGSAVVAYKQSAIYLGAYIGPPQVWDFRQVAGNVGALSHEAIASIAIQGTPAHFFVSDDDIYLFDGSRPVPIGSPVREWFFADIHPSYKAKTIVVADNARSLVRIYYADSTSTGMLNASLIYNYKTKTWGRGPAQSIEWAGDYAPGSVTWDDLGTYYSTWNDFPSAQWDSAFQAGGSTIPAVFDSSHVIKTMSGAAAESSFTTGDFGLDDGISFLSRVRPRMASGAMSGSMTNYYRDAIQDALVADAVTPMDDGRFDVTTSARWHRLQFDLQGDYEILGLDVALDKDADE